MPRLFGTFVFGDFESEHRVVKPVVHSCSTTKLAMFVLSNYLTSLKSKWLEEKHENSEVIHKRDEMICGIYFKITRRGSKTGQELVITENG